MMISIRERIEKLIFDPSEIERIRGEIFLTTRSIRGVQARKRKGEMIVLTFFFLSLIWRRKMYIFE